MPFSIIKSDKALVEGSALLTVVGFEEAEAF